MKYHVGLSVTADLAFTIDVQDEDEASAARQAWNAFQLQFLNLDLGQTVVTDVQVSNASVLDEGYDNECLVDCEMFE